MNIEKVIKGTLVAIALSGVAVAGTATTASAANIVGVQIGPVGLGFTVNNSHYYDRRQRHQAYSYPSDWQTYHPRRPGITAIGNGTMRSIATITAIKAVSVPDRC